MLESQFQNFKTPQGILGPSTRKFKGSLKTFACDLQGQQSFEILLPRAEVKWNLWRKKRFKNVNIVLFFIFAQKDPRWTQSDMKSPLYM